MSSKNDKRKNQDHTGRTRRQHENKKKKSNDEDENESAEQTEQNISKNTFINKKRPVLSWTHAIDKVFISNNSEKDWLTQDGHNISADFRNFQLESIERLRNKPTFSYVNEINQILCLSSIIYCNETKSKFITCSEKIWNDVCSISLTPNTLPSVVNQMIIEYSFILDDKQLLDERWHGNWSKWNELSTKEDKNMFDCAQIVARNFKFNSDKDLDEDTFIHRYYHNILEEIINKDDFALIWANGESESSKVRRKNDKRKCGRKSDFRILSKIRGTNKEILFGEVKPPRVKSSMNESIVKIAEFMKGSLDFLIDCYGYIDGLETYGILIYGDTIRIFTMDLVYDGLYRFNLTSKILLPTENANFLTIITVVSTFYSLLERIKSTVVVINSNSPRHLLDASSYCRQSNSSPQKIYNNE